MNATENDLIEFLHARVGEDPAPDAVAVGLVSEESGRRASTDTTGVYLRTLRQLASRYADHPDYREEWRP